MPRLEHPPRQRRPHPPCAHDHDEHSPDLTTCPVSLRQSGGAVRRTRQGALRSTYSVTSPISGGREAPTPPRTEPPLIRVGGSAPRTIASTSRSRAASTMPPPTLRDLIRCVRTSTASYSLPTSLARPSARCACSR